jgi:hypothetical protein
MSNDNGNRPLLRIIAILRFLDEESLGHPERETFEYTFQHWVHRDKLFSDMMGVERAIDTVKSETNGRISAKIEEREEWVDEPVVSAAISSQKVHRKVRYITFFIETQSALREYLSAKKAELTDKLPDAKFLLNFEGTKCHIRVINDVGEKVITLNQKGRPYKIVSLLRSNSSTTSELAIELGITKKKIRDAINDVREKINLKFGVDGKLLIENTDEKFHLRRVTYAQ